MARPKKRVRRVKLWWPKELGDPAKLPRRALVSVVREIQRELWVDDRGRRGEPRFNRDKEWEGADALNRIVETLELFDLSPAEETPQEAADRESLEGMHAGG
jgi:hypothetical protein